MRCRTHANSLESTPAVNLPNSGQPARPWVADVDRLKGQSARDQRGRQATCRTSVTELAECIVSPAERRSIEREGAGVGGAGRHGEKAEIAVDSRRLVDDRRVGANAQLSGVVRTPAIADSILRDAAVMRSAGADLRPDQV